MAGDPPTRTPTWSTATRAVRRPRGCVGSVHARGAVTSGTSPTARKSWRTTTQSSSERRPNRNRSRRGYQRRERQGGRRQRVRGRDAHPRSTKSANAESKIIQTVGTGERGSTGSRSRPQLRRRPRERRAGLTGQFANRPDGRHDRGLRRGLAGVERGARLTDRPVRQGRPGQGADRLRRDRDPLRRRRRLRPPGSANAKPDRLPTSRGAPRASRACSGRSTSIRRSTMEAWSVNNTNGGPNQRAPFGQPRLPWLRRRAGEGDARLRHADAGGRGPGHWSGDFRTRTTTTRTRFRPRRNRTASSPRTCGRVRATTCRRSTSTTRRSRPSSHACSATGSRSRTRWLRAHGRRERPLRGRELERRPRGATRFVQRRCGPAVPREPGGERDSVCADPERGTELLRAQRLSRNVLP